LLRTISDSATTDQREKNGNASTKVFFACSSLPVMIDLAMTPV
jgi:hypothetical protein